MKPFTICVLLAFTFLDLTPFIFNYELIHNHDCQLYRVLQTQLTLVTFVFAAASMTPLAVDVLCYVFHRDKFFLLERSILLISCVFPSVLAFIRTHPRAAEVFVCLNNIQGVWSVAALSNGMKKSDSKFFRSSLCDMFYFLAACNQGLSPFVELKGDTGLYFVYVSNIFFVLAVLLLLYMYIGYLRDMWIGVSDVSKEIRANEYLPLICSTVILIFAFSYTGVIIGFSMTYIQDLNQEILCFSIFITCGIAIVSTLLPGRIARTQVREIESSLEIKRSFVRYIGHEIRTPLNIASIGLDLLSSMDLLQLSEEAAHGHQQLNSIVNSMDDNAGDLRKEYALENMDRAESQDTYDSNFPAMYPAISNGVTPRTRGDMRSSAYKTSLRQASVQSQKVIEQQQTVIQDMDKIITEVRNAVNLGTKVLNDLLAYDKLDSNNLMLEKSVIALEDLAHATLSMFAVQASSKAIKFDVKVSIASCSMWCLLKF
jgi:signal transduction histidine kinase